MDDNELVAMLAAQTEGHMRRNLMGSRDLGYNRTDYRKFLSPQQQQQQYMAQQGYPPQYGHPQPPPMQYTPPMPEDQNAFGNVPDGVLPPAQTRLLQMPPGFAPPPDILPNGNPQGMPQQPMRYDGQGQSFENFNMPNYGGKAYLEDEEEFREALTKEVRSQKRALSKLTKTVEQLMVKVQQLTDVVNNLTTHLNVPQLPPPPITEPVDENKTKS